MSKMLQHFLAAGLCRASSTLAAAVLRLPENQRDRRPAGERFSAIDRVAECAIVNACVADLVRTHTWPHEKYIQWSLEARADAEPLRARLEHSAGRLAVAIWETPDEMLDMEVAIGSVGRRLSAVLAYPYWNMIYCEERINNVTTIFGRSGEAGSIYDMEAPDVSYQESITVIPV